MKTLVILVHPSLENSRVATIYQYIQESSFFKNVDSIVSGGVFTGL